LQTKGQQQFKITWRVIVIIVLCLAALALPLGGVILTLHKLTQSRAPQETASDASEALQSRLEGIVDKRLAPARLPPSEARIELIADDLNGERAYISELLTSYGGSSISRFEGETEIRLLVQVPPERLEDFLAACQGKESGSIGIPPGGFLEVVIKRSKSP
jgi:hypothetical protein